MIRDFILEIFKLIGELNYWHIGLLTALESTCFPVVIPVETIIIPMGYYAYLGIKSLPLLIIASTIGIVCGCVINYYFAMLLGRKFIYKNAKLLHINIEKMKRLEGMFLRHGRLLMFTGRFVPIPAFKHIITIPAGMAKMPIGQFIFYNMLGGLIFSTSMLLIGYFFGSSEELIHKAIGKFTIACIVIFVTYIIVRIIAKVIAKRHGSERYDDIYVETVDANGLKSKQKDNNLPYSMYRVNNNDEITKINHEYKNDEKKPCEQSGNTNNKIIKLKKLPIKKINFFKKDYINEKNKNKNDTFSIRSDTRKSGKFRFGFKKKIKK